MLDKGDFFGLYTENPDKVNLAVLYNEGGLISARVLLWKTDQGDIVMDRVYASSEELKGLMEQWGKMKGYVQSINSLGYKYTITLDNFEFAEYPYLDTFKYLSVKGVLSNVQFEKVSYYTLTNANGVTDYTPYKFWVVRDTQAENVFEIKDFLNNCNILDYEIHDDLSVTINDNYIDFSIENLKIIPINIRGFKGFLNLEHNKYIDISRGGLPEYVEGSINLSHCRLKSLVGLPKIIDSSLIIEGSILEDFTGSPIKVGGNLIAKNCSIKSLNGSPEEVGGIFNVSGNSIKNLKGCPKKVREFDLSSNEIESMEGISETIVETNLNISKNYIEKVDAFPKYIGSLIDISNNNLLNLEGFPKKADFSINVSNNNLNSLKGSPEIVNGIFMVYQNHFENLIGAPRIIGDNCIFKYNKNLISLEGAPNLIGGNLVIEYNGVEFKEDEIRKNIKVSGEVIC
jgi:hypothetical protein